MKTYITFITALLISISSFAQQGINYKAVIKDGGGSILASQEIDLKFSIIEDFGSTVVYTEDHDNIMTNANGIIILNIGEGTTTDVFGDINWGSDTHSLKTEIDLDNDTNYDDLGTTVFKAVPYALNVTGLEKITENDGTDKTGWRIVGRIPENYGNIGNNAIDLSYSNTESTDSGATGTSSIAMGKSTVASGQFSTAAGLATFATGYASTAIGFFSTASGQRSFAAGSGAIASGIKTISLGFSTKAESYNSLTIGRYNIGGGYAGDFNNPDAASNWVLTDPLFEIGNGSDNNNRSNALTILKNGTITAPSFELVEITDNKALVTKEYADNVASGLEQITENDGTEDNTGWRLKGVDPANYYNIGDEAVDLSIQLINDNIGGAEGEKSLAIGVEARATGDRSIAIGSSSKSYGFTSTAIGNSVIASNHASVAMGQASQAIGNVSIAIGNFVEAIGSSAVALGAFTDAIGLRSTAMGSLTKAQGHYSTAMGNGTIAHSYAETVIGQFSKDYTIGALGESEWNPTDRLFVVANGTATNVKSNALTILKNGNIGIGDITNPLYPIHLDGRIQFGDQEYIAPGTGPFEIIANGGIHSTVDAIDNLGTSSLRYNSVYASNGVITTSDKRDKTNISTLDYGLAEVMQLEPVSFNWKSNANQEKKLGLIAQDLLQVIPEVVKTYENVSTNENDRAKTKRVEMDRMGVYYSDLIPVLINAIQEQQETIESLKSRIEALEN